MAESLFGSNWVLLFAFHFLFGWVLVGWDRWVPCSWVRVVFCLIAFGTCCLMRSWSLWVVRPTYRLSQWHTCSWITVLLWLAGSTSFLAAGSMHWLEKIKRGDTAPYQFFTALLTWCSNCWEVEPIHGALRYTGHFSGPKGLAVENCAILLDMCLSTISSGYPLSSKIFLIKSISCLSLFFVHIISALCTSVAIRFVFRLRGLKDSQRIYWPEKLGFRYTLVSKLSSVLSTRMSINGSLPSCSFSKLILTARCRRSSVTRKSSTPPSCLKMAKVCCCCCSTGLLPRDGSLLCPKRTQENHP